MNTLATSNTPRFFTTEQLALMLELQARQNNVLDPAGLTWRGASRPYHSAILSEASEGIDHLGWPWWKPSQEPDLVSASVEVIDILHFTLSGMIRDNPTWGWEELAASEVEMAVDRTILVDDQSWEMPTMALADLFHLSHVLAFLGRWDISCIAEMCERCNMSPDDAFRLYTGKAALNLMRQAHGYKQGDYRKNGWNWNWIEPGTSGPAFDEYGEDNDFLQCLMATLSLLPGFWDNPQAAYDRIYSELEKAYTSGISSGTYLLQL